MPTKVSEPFRLRVVARGPDDSAWLGGNGNWADSTFRTLQAIVDSINPTTGGWAEIHNTKLDLVLVPRSVVNAIDPSIWQVTGPRSMLMVWGSAGFDGKSFLIGAVGGHSGYNGVEFYRIRITDSPAAIRMYDPPPLRPGKGDQPCVWDDELRAMHQYDGVFWDTSINKLIVTGTARSVPVWTFDPNAPTPKSAWHKLSPHDPANAINYPTICKFTADEIYIYTNRSHNGMAVNLKTGARRVPRRPPDPWSGNGPFFTGGYNYLERRSASDRYVFYTKMITRDSATHVLTYDTVDGRALAPSAGNLLPSWFYSEKWSHYRTLTTTDDQNFALGWYGTHRVWCWDRAADAMHEFTARGASQPTYPDAAGVNGINGRWVCVNATTPKCFVGVNSCIQNAWVFRPPVAWGIS